MVAPQPVRFPPVRRLLALSVAVTTLALAAYAAADPGVTPTEILIGGTVPLTGEAAAFGSVGPSAKAYFPRLRGPFNTMTSLSLCRSAINACIST